MQLTRRSVFSCVSGVPVLVLVVRRRSGFLHPTESPHEQGLVAVASSSDLVTLEWCRGTTPGDHVTGYIYT